MIPGGRSRSVFAIIACTSCAAASMLRSSANWIVICVDPRFEIDVMLSMPAIVENCFSSGVATADAIVSGLAPGSDAETWIVGKSTVGRSLTGRRRYAVIPNTTRPSMNSTVVTGRRMNSAERFIRRFPRPVPPTAAPPASVAPSRRPSRQARDATARPRRRAHPARRRARSP